MQDLLPWMAPWGVWSLYGLMMVGGGALVWQGWFDKRLHDDPTCPKCGYDRTGLPGAACPECGHAVTHPWEPYVSRRRRHGLVLLGLVVALALPSVAVTRRVRAYGWEYYRRVGPVYWMFPTQTLWSHRAGEYEVLCVQDPARGWANSGFYSRKLLIRRSGEVVHEDTGDVLVLEHDPAPGTDLNANGSPDVVVHFFSVGSGTYQRYRIFELGPAGLVTLAEFSAKGETSAARFVDADGDGIWEIICADWIYDGERSYSVPSVLLWDGRQFTRHTPPPAEAAVPSPE